MGVNAYRVYDIIDAKGVGKYDDTMRVYDIARVENKADNPFIRFRI